VEVEGQISLQTDAIKGVKIKIYAEYLFKPGRQPLMNWRKRMEIA